MQEPGSQVEYAGPPLEDLRAAHADLSRTLQDLTAHAVSRGVSLLSAGIDPLGGHAEQSLTGARYPAMHAYFGRRSPHGHQMMTGTASIQVNLDLGSPACAADRWRTAQLVAPLATATFANSPVPGAVNGRAAVWRSLDPTRTGIPHLFCQGEDDPVDVLVQAARRADVMVFNRGGHGITGEPGFSFGRWLDEGHPVHGSPTTADAMTHLSTLFPEVRTRASEGTSFLEIRSVDALPATWRTVPAVLYCGLLYDPEARAVARQVMEPHRAALPLLLDRASRLGLWDPELCAMAVEVWSAAASAARRLGPTFVDPADVAVAERYLDTFTMRGRAPSDVLRRCGEQGRDAVLANCAEPLLLTGGSR